jgi:hypothetical protein
MIEAESQAVLNTLREHDIHWMHLNKGRSAGNGTYAGRGLLRGWWWPVGPKLVFEKMAAPVSEIMGYFILPKMVRLPQLTASVVNS